MALVVADRIQETTSTTGTGAYTLAGAKAGFQSFAAVGDGNTTYYACTDGTDYEVGIGTYTLSGTTLARTTIIESSNSDAAVNWGAGSKDIFVTSPAGKTLLVGRNLYADNPSSATMPSATGTNAIAIGDSAVSSAINSFAIGAETEANGNRTVALGWRAYASGNDAVAIATDTTVHNGTYGATGGNSFAVGQQSLSSASYSTAIGKDTKASGNYSTAIGVHSTGSGSQAISGAGAMALGGSYASGTDSFAAAIANNTSSYGATGANSIAMGYLSKATSANSIAIGNQNTASGHGSFSHGMQAVATVTGQRAYASGQFAAAGDAQGGQFILRADTTDATATVLTTNNSTAASTNQIVAASDTCITFDGTITAMQNGAQAYASWKIEGLLVNDGGTTTLANSATTVISNADGWGVALSADNTNNALAITCTGEAAHNIRWVANIRTSEVTYA